MIYEKINPFISEDVPEGGETPEEGETQEGETPEEGETPKEDGEESEGM